MVLKVIWIFFLCFSLQKELETSGKNCEEIKSKARRDRLTLENQLDMEKVRAEVERKKFASQLEVLQKEKVLGGVLIL